MNKPWYVDVVDEDQLRRCVDLVHEIWPKQVSDALCIADEPDAKVIDIAFIANDPPGYVEVDIGGDTVLGPVLLERLEPALRALAGVA